MKVIAIEGLAGYDDAGISEGAPYVAGRNFKPMTKVSEIHQKGGHLALNIIARLKTFALDVDFEVYEWDHPPRHKELQTAELIIGHGFGAAWICGRNDIPKGSMVITVDPFWTGFDAFKNFGHHLPWFNFYQRTKAGGFLGCKVDGADNTLITDRNYTGLVRIPDILNHAKDFVEKKTEGIWAR